MHLDIITPDEHVFSGETNGVKLPGTEGSFEVLTNHASLIGTLGKGQVKIVTSTGESFYQIDGGLVEVLNNKIVVLAESVEK